jgi:hypothetical protein
MAIKLSEKAAVAPEKLAAFLEKSQGSSFTPSGVLRVNVDDEESEQLLRIARDVLLEIRVAD